MAPHARPTALLLIFLTLGVVLAAPTAAQERPDPGASTATEGVTQRVLLDNDRVLMVENRYEAGATSPSHTHRWPRTVYVVRGGVLELVAEDGTESRVEVARGQAMWRPAETHVVRNVGVTLVVVVETEVKGDGTAPADVGHVDGPRASDPRGPRR